MADDNVQHGIDDNPVGDPEKGAALGGLGGAVVGAAAGSMVGPAGTAVGAVVGGLLGAGGSGAAVAAVDNMDNDNTVSGVGDGVTTDVSDNAAASMPATGYGTGSLSGDTVVGSAADNNYGTGTAGVGTAADNNYGTTTSVTDPLTGAQVHSTTGRRI